MDSAKRRKVVGITSVAFLVGASFICFQFQQASNLADWSAAKSIHERVLMSIEEHKTKYGQYPEAITELELSFEGSDGAGPNTLNRFHYRKLDDSYVLTLPPPQ